ncbi:MAG: NlpC/P60 family protein [Streptosporangiales bacterium]|nr:NlpC/P60 family protein [Streptosporangiales bacterium]
MVTAGALALPQGVASADPSEGEVRDRIDKLMRDSSKLVDDYNQAVVDRQAAAKRYKKVKAQLKTSEAEFNELKTKVAQLAAAAYRTGDLTSPMTMITSEDPQSLLDQVATLNHMSKVRASQFEEYAAVAERLAKLRADAKSAYDEALAAYKKINKKKNAVESKLAEQRRILARYTTPAPGGIPQNYTGPASGNARVALQFAYQQIGDPYGYGANGPDSWDCSSLTQNAWGAAGVSLPRTSQAQWNAGTRVTKAALQPGDLVFFYDSSAPSHMGMYAGNGKMVHAPSSGKTVQEVDMDGYYWANFVGGVRP